MEDVKVGWVVPNEGTAGEGASMIRSDKEYRVARTRLNETKQAIVQQRIEYAEMGLDIATANMFIGSTLAQQQQIQDEIVEYENARACSHGAERGATSNSTSRS